MRVLGVRFGSLLIAFRYVLAQSASPVDFQSQVEYAKETPHVLAATNASDANSSDHVSAEQGPAELVTASATSTHSITILHPPSRNHSHSGSRTISFTGSRTLPISHHFFTPTQTGPFNPPNTARPLPDLSSPPHRQSVVAIVFECIAGLVGLLILIWLTRCIYKYKRTPRQDRIASLLARHHLEREMEQLEREQMMRRSRRTSLLRPPPPPYQHAPAYDDAVAGPSSV
ncbi:hypothetical protein QCA50_000005 [Cerrena zonata]|uniref:Transmembrane protein n=1 Tax=Cerrena zonata TaxID=2478898 RepID=A0AAW0GQ84_9APHY